METKWYRVIIVGMGGMLKTGEEYECKNCLLSSVPKRSCSAQNSFCQGTKWWGPANLQEMKAMVCFQGPESCQCLVLAHLKGKHSSDLWQRVWQPQLGRHIENQASVLESVICSFFQIIWPHPWMLIHCINPSHARCLIWALAEQHIPALHFYHNGVEYSVHGSWPADLETMLLLASIPGLRVELRAEIQQPGQLFNTRVHHPLPHCAKSQQDSKDRYRQEKILLKWRAP